MFQFNQAASPETLGPKFDPKHLYFSSSTRMKVVQTNIVSELVIRFPIVFDLSCFDTPYGFYVLQRPQDLLHGP